MVGLAAAAGDMDIQAREEWVSLAAEVARAIRLQTMAPILPRHWTPVAALQPAFQAAKAILTMEAVAEELALPSA
jgi:hypothetical protein